VNLSLKYYNRAHSDLLYGSILMKNELEKKGKMSLKIIYKKKQLKYWILMICGAKGLNYRTF